MICGYIVTPQDGRAYYFSDAVLASLSCPLCRSVLDDAYIPSALRPARRLDAWSSFDHRDVFSRSIVEWLRSTGVIDVDFEPVGDGEKWWRIKARRIVEIDHGKSRVETGPVCDACGKYTWVTIQGPWTLKDICAPLSPGLYQTNTLFGSHWEKQPALIFATETKKLADARRFRGLGFRTLYSADHVFKTDRKF